MGVRITGLKPTKRGLIALFCDGSFCFSVDGTLLEQHGLGIGSELAPELLAELREAGENTKAIQKALRLLAVRGHSEKELTDKLTRHYDSYTAENAVRRMQELGYLQDLEFAESYARDLLTRRHNSLRTTRYKLREKGIDTDLIEQVLAPYQQNDADSIRTFIEKNERSVYRTAKDRSQLIRSLERRGFSGRDIREVLDEWESEHADAVAEE